MDTLPSVIPPERFESTSTGELVPFAPAKGPIHATLELSDGRHVAVVEVVRWFRQLGIWTNLLAFLWNAYEAVSPIFQEIAAQFAQDPRKAIDWRAVLIRAAFAIFFGMGALKGKTLNRATR